MLYSVQELRKIETWPESVWFAPFVGERYDQGVDGPRVLILGESHYEKDVSKLAGQDGGERGLTWREFCDCELKDQPGSRAWGTFFRRLDNIVTQQLTPDEATAAKKWKHVAFANFIQTPLARARQRPKSELWKSGKTAFPILLEMLRPQVILVLGAATFNHTPDSPGCRIGEIEVGSSQLKRSLWKMTYDGGSAFMSWVYHPSWPRDKKETYIKVFGQLLNRAQVLTSVE